MRDFTPYLVKSKYTNGRLRIKEWRVTSREYGKIRCENPIGDGYESDGDDIMLDGDVEIYDIKGNCITKIFYYNDGQIYKIMKFVNNILHCTDGPAKISWHINGNIDCMEYWKNGDRDSTLGYYGLHWYEGGKFAYRLV